MKFTREFPPKDGNCLVIMPHGKAGNRNWDDYYKEVIAEAITEVGMKPMRADAIYSAQQQIIERTWKSIQEAEVIIADLTGRDPNVMYELGLCHVIRKPVILIVTEGDDIPNDLIQYPPIRYVADGLGPVQLMKELKKALQIAHDEPKNEAGLVPLTGTRSGGTIERVSAKVLTVTEHFATIQAADGRKGFLNAEDANWLYKNPNLTKFYKQGDDLDGAFVSDPNGEPKYSLIAIQDDPWERLKLRFPVNQEFTGSIVSVIRNGVFVRMDFGINGFIPANTISDHLERNDEIKAVTVKIDQHHRNVELRFIRKLLQSSAVSPQHEEWNFFVGQQFNGTVAAVNPSKGYALVQINEETKGLLHITDMDETVKKKFDASELQVGDEIKVEIRQVNKVDRKLNLKSNGM